MKDQIKQQLKEEVKSLCRYFDWEEESEQAHEVSTLMDKVYNRAIKDALKALDRMDTDVVDRDDRTGYMQAILDFRTALNLLLNR